MMTPIKQAKKIYLTAPLPFMGQKRRFVWEFRDALKEFPDAPVFVDLFGGSGLLSYTAKQVYPNARVIYNDFDDYHQRLENITRTNELLADLKEIVQDCEHDKKLPAAVKARILQRVDVERRTGFVDYVTLSASLLFSMNYVTSFEELSKQTMYNVVKSTGYNSDNYLDGLEIVKMDYKQLFERYRHLPKVVFIVDPPYLSTEAGAYKGYWRLSDYLDVLKVLKGTYYIYFTSNKSSILELCTWLHDNLNADNPFEGATLKEHVTNPTSKTSYMDMMLYKTAI